MTLNGADIFLDHENKRLPVPRYLYKIITEKKSGLTEVYVVNNNPYEDVTNIESEIGNSFSDKAIILSGNFLDVSKGYTFMVPFDEFIKIVDISFVNQTVNNHSIPLSQGQIQIVQDPNQLHILQVRYDMEMTLGKMKGILSRLHNEKSIFTFSIFLSRKTSRV